MTRVEKVLNRMPEVSAVVNFATEKVQINFNPQSASIEALIATVQRAGYDAQLRAIRNPHGYTTWGMIACSGRKPLR